MKIGPAPSNGMDHVVGPAFSTAKPRQTRAIRSLCCSLAGSKARMLHQRPVFRTNF